jgi:hypothetical protein
VLRPRRLQRIGHIHHQPAVANKHLGLAPGDGARLCGAALTNTNCGNVTNCVAYNNYAQVSSGGTILANSLPAWSQGAVLGIAVDLTAHPTWVRMNSSSGWNGGGTANPATGVGGINIYRVTGSLFYAGAELWGDPGTQAKFNFGGSAYTYGAPSGFSNW